MVEKSRLLASVEDPGVDLSSVITLQRRLNTIERDIAALPSKVFCLLIFHFRKNFARETFQSSEISDIFLINFCEF